MHPIGKAITHDDTQTSQLDIDVSDYCRRLSRTIDVRILDVSIHRRLRGPKIPALIIRSSPRSKKYFSSFSRIEC